MTAKVCARCKETKTREMFSLQSHAIDGLQPRCKACNALDAKKRPRKADREASLAKVELLRLYPLEVKRLRAESELIKATNAQLEAKNARLEHRIKELELSTPVNSAPDEYEKYPDIFLG
jgi:hypothetical protein